MKNKREKADIISVLVFFALILLVFRGCPTDSTDVSKWNRSGMALYIDNRTGCHYLEAGMIGGITPRLDKNGEHICDGAED